MEQKTPMILAVDCGTQSMRAAVIDQKGNILAMEKKVYDPPYVSERPYWAEREADAYWEELCMLTQQIRRTYPEYMKQVQGITLTTQRDSVVVVDKAGNPLRKAILWMDQRKAKNKRKIVYPLEVGSRIIGMKDTVENFSRRCPAHWMME
ncbi:MAG TPA: carbohydrate kinase, partial [Eubacteriaceae bacterium]|nr:carbohydrate kinase [Eubacteriaceae bacterium]